jgi:O-antigen ligase
VYVAAILTPIALTSGGYWPTVWGWGALVALWTTALVLLLAGEICVSRLELGMISALMAFAAWTLLSAAWSWSATASVRESQRTLLYVAALVAFVVLARAATSTERVLAGLALAVFVASTYALATRLFPDRLGIVDTFANNRLSEPIGYWNAVGIFAALGILFAVALADGSRRRWLAALAAALLPVLLATLYFTFSRGSWIALAAGSLAAIALSNRRLRLLSTLLLLTPAPALAVFVAYRSDSLTRLQSTFTGATDEGRRLAILLVALTIVNGGIVAARSALDRRVTLGPRVRRTYGFGLTGLLAVALVAVLAQYGGPVKLARETWRDFSGPPPSVKVSLNERLFSLSSSGRIPQWDVAWETFTDHPGIGTGAGTYEQSWLLERDTDGKVRDAHNLYLETGAELGIVGLVLLVVTLAFPLAAAFRARRNLLVPATFGAYVAYLLHAGVDWDWEIPAVTVAGLVAGGLLLVAARSDGARTVSGNARAIAATGAIVLGAVAFVGLRGNVALARSIDAFGSADYPTAASEARTAQRWAPWSSEPWQRLAQAELAQRHRPEARHAFLKAIEKDPRNWELWIGLAASTSGSERGRALAEVARLNPRASAGAG